MRISVIGLGRIGRRLAGHLLAAGHETAVWNRSAEPVDALVASGARACRTPAEAFQAEIVISVLFDDVAVRDILLDPELLAGAKHGPLHICMSTISPALANELHAASRAHGFRYLSAPLFGRPEAAEAKALNILVSGEQPLIETAGPILSLFGKIWPVGSGPCHANYGKIAGNFMIGCAVEAMSEASVLMQSAGADHAAFLRMMADTLFAAPIYRLYGPAVGGTVALPPQSLAIPQKDLGLMNDVAAEQGVQAPFAAALRTQIEKARQLGFAQADWSAAFPSVLKARGHE